MYAGTGRLEGAPFNLGVMNFAFMGGSMGSVVGEKIARLARRSADKDAARWSWSALQAARGCRRGCSP